MPKALRNLSLVFFALFSLNAFAQEPGVQVPSAHDLYLNGIKSYQESKFAEASDAFRLAHDKDPDNRAILFNWGLSEYQLSRLGMAAATWRRALALDPEYIAASQALTVLKDRLPSQHFQSSGFFESFRAYILVYVSATQVAASTLLLLFVSGWLLLRFLGMRKKALDTEQPLPPFPTVGFSFFLIFLLSAFVGLGKAYDFFRPRATVVVNTASVYSGPSDQSSSLFELSEGFEVIMNRAEGAWRQISSPGGLSGWVRREALFQTSGTQIREKETAAGTP